MPNKTALKLLDDIIAKVHGEDPDKELGGFNWTTHHLLLLKKELQKEPPIYEIYRDARIAAFQWRLNEFPFGEVVSYLGEVVGTVDGHSDCPPDQIPIRFENGNTWWKNVEDVKVVTDSSLWPGWIKRIKNAQ